MELYTENKNKHNKAVAEIMYENAEALGVDKEVAYAVGLLHDIGYIVNKTKHGELGADIVKRLGVKGDSVDAIRYHGADPFEMLRNINIFHPCYVYCGLQTSQLIVQEIKLVLINDYTI